MTKTTETRQDDMILRFEAATTTGSRDKNQDAFIVNTFISSADTVQLQTHSGESASADKLFVCALCDGIGMFKRSGQASQRALETVREQIALFSAGETEDPAEALSRWVRQTVISANNAVIGLNRQFGAGGCTIVLLAIYQDCYALANMGDSPAFLLENDTLRELSVRHTMAYLKRLLGQEPVEGENHILLHYLGEQDSQTSLTISEKNGKICKNFCFFLCSDGVSGELSENEIKKCLSSQIPVQDIVGLAGEAQTADNCTAIAVRFFADDREPRHEATENIPGSEDGKPRHEAIESIPGSEDGKPRHEATENTSLTEVEKQQEQQKATN